MHTTGPFLLLLLVAAIGVIVLLVARLRLHPFLAILLGALTFGLAARALGALLAPDRPVITDLTGHLTSGFGDILADLGLVVAFGTAIGKILERSGATATLARAALRACGRWHPAVGMSVMGWAVSLAIYCDSGFVVLSPVKRSVARDTGRSPVVLATALSTGLYASHTFVPPAAGPVAAAANMGIAGGDLIWLILVAVPVSLVSAGAGLYWAVRRADRAGGGTSVAALKEQLERETADLTAPDPAAPHPPLWHALAPLLVPIALMAAAAVTDLLTDTMRPTGWTATALGALRFAGGPTVALLIGLLLALALLLPERGETILTDWLGDSLADAGPVLMIVGAGGAFGAVITATPLTACLKSLIQGHHAVGGLAALLVLFAASALIKSAQGSSTAALIITTSIFHPLLPTLGLDVSTGPVPVGSVLAVLAIGAGSMVVSHVNDSYFWIVARLTGMDLPTAYRAQTLGTLVQGTVALAATLGLAVVLLPW
ncbi:GntP family permease [Streptomyces sp. NPDC005820]|uniref:GntP family permease n=1 Tax=Streptomyces sp. NPDC005820 TaxID=3157069 RepID=UPI003402D3FE